MFVFLLAVAFSQNAPVARVPKAIPANKAIPINKAIPVNQASCDICQILVNAIRDLIESKSTVEAITEYVNSLCTVFSESVQPVCTTISNVFIPIIIDLISIEIDEFNICNKIGFCTATLKPWKSNNNVAPFRRSQQTRRPHVVARHQVRASPACTICKEIVEMVDQLLEDKKLEEEITEAVVQYCQYLPAPYNSLCAAYVESGIPVVISYIEEGFDSLDICGRIGFCDATRGALRIQKAHPKEDVNGLIDCPLCKQVVEYIKRQLESDRVEEHVAALVAQLCARLPETLANTCNTIVLQYVPVIMKMVDEKMEPVAICVSLGMCSASTKTAPRRAARLPKKAEVIPKQKEYVPVQPIQLPTKDYVKGTGCEMCNKLAEYIEQLLLDEKVEEEITKLVSELCTTFPAPYTSICSLFVQEYLPIVIVWVQGGISKLDICTKIGLC